MKDDEELELLLNEIPHATSNNLYHHHHHLHQEQNGLHVHGGHGDKSLVTETDYGFYGMCNGEHSSHMYAFASSPVSGFSLPSDGSSSSLFSAGDSLSDNGAPTPPPFEELKTEVPCGSSHCTNNFLWNSETSDLLGNRAKERLIDEMSLCRNVGNIRITNEQINSSNYRDFQKEFNRLPARSRSLNRNSRFDFERYEEYDNPKTRLSDGLRPKSSVSKPFESVNGEKNPALLGLRQEYRPDDLFKSGLSPVRSDAFYTQYGRLNSSRSSSRHTTKDQMSGNHQRGNPVSNSLHKLSMAAAPFCASQDKISWSEGIAAPHFSGSTSSTHSRAYSKIEFHSHYSPVQSYGWPMVPSSLRVQGREPFNSEESLIIESEDLSFVANNLFNRSRAKSKGTFSEIGTNKHRQKSQLDVQNKTDGILDNVPSGWLSPILSLPPKFSSLTEAQGYIYLIAKDQHGCRFLQRVFDEGAPQEVQMIFDEIVTHVVELMMNPFGNYLMQKLLDVCSEKQRMQILLEVTKVPGELVRISLNTHGTRVVQKLIETLKTRQQIQLVISALEPGFLALIRDLNGNHVVQRCLQCLSDEHNMFIFVAAAKYCVEIATHQHGCFVLQRCISHSAGKHQETLVAEISKNALKLAQNPYGNYVVQFILELKIPSAMSNLMCEFEGNYVHLSMQKFSSHVVEKCLIEFNDESRSRVIHELLSAPHFEQLVQDPHANYVIQRALKVSEGHMHSLLIGAIETCKAMARNSPYSKNILSQKFRKK